MVIRNSISIRILYFSVKSRIIRNFYIYSWSWSISRRIYCNQSNCINSIWSKIMRNIFSSSRFSISKIPFISYISSFICKSFKIYIISRSCCNFIYFYITCKSIIWILSFSNRDFSCCFWGIPLLISNCQSNYIISIFSIFMVYILPISLLYISKIPTICHIYSICDSYKIYFFSDIWSRLIYYYFTF